MATGGTPLARLFLILLTAAFAVVSFDRPACAQEDAKAKLMKGIELLRIGDRESVEQAIKVLREAIAADLSSEDAIAALSQAESQAWQALINLMASGAEGANVAKVILEIATPRLPERAFDEAELRRLVKTAVEAEGYSDRFDASMSLARVYGEFAVPYLVAYLGSSNTEQKINAHITLMNRIGRDAVLPLNEAVLKGDANARLMAASELGVIGDERALPALAEVVTNDEDANVRAAASKAFEKLVAKFPWAADMTASELYLRLGKLYYDGDYRVLTYSDRPLVLWSWTDKLTGTPVPRHLYVLKLAEEACYDAMRLNETNAASRALLARVIASQKQASETVAGMSEDELTAAYDAGLAKAAGLVASMGWDTLTRAVSDCLDERDAAAGAFIVGVMPFIYGGEDFTADNPFVRATNDASGAVRMAAAESILRFNETRRITAFPDPDGFMSLVARSVGEIIPRNILVIDSRDDRRNKMLSELAKAKFLTYDARTGSTGYLRARRFVGLDLIVVTPDLGDMELLGLLLKLGEDERTKTVPIVIVGTVEQASNDEWRSLYQEKAARLAGLSEQPGPAPAEFVEAVTAAFGGDSPGAKLRYMMSAEVLDALASTDTGNALFNWNSLTETLAGLLTADVPDDPPVRLNAIRAMANIADPAAMGALVSYFAGADDGPIKAAAGLAIASICHNSPQTLDDAAFQALLKGTQSEELGVRVAAFAALGSAQLTPAQAVATARANRPTAAAGGGE